MRGNFSLDHHHLLTTDMGYLVPVASLEVLPGDSFRHRTSMLVRVAPLATPVMHPVEVRLHHWYVPNRIIWSDWDTWITGENEVATMPTVSWSAAEVTATPEIVRLADHLNIPARADQEYCALPFRAYNLIWNEFYRDQDLHTAEDLDNLFVKRICWEKDYFTVARDRPQQGDAVTIPFAAGTQAPVTGIGVRPGDVPSTVTGTNWKDSQGTRTDEAFDLASDVGRIAGNVATGLPEVFADLSQVSGGGIDINDFRRAMALQRFAEARARFGDRYIDYLRYLGVNPRDGRLDRPEYLGGGKQVISFSEVLATAESASVNVGDMFGHGIASLGTRTYQKMFEEHGWVLTLASVRPKTIYADAVPRKYTRTDPMHYWQRELEVEPWQPVYANEVTSLGDRDAIWGYQNKYEEYRHEMSYVSGSFRYGTENTWHMAREFGVSVPDLNGSFVECTPTDRVYSDTSMPELLINARHNISARRLVRQVAVG